MKCNINPQCDASIDYIEQLLCSETPPEIPDQFKNNERLLRVHEKILELRRILELLSIGNLSFQPVQSGIILDYCKILQEHLQNMVLKIQRIEEGDYSQRMDFMRDFSIPFNRVLSHLENTIEMSQEKEVILAGLANSLQKTLEQRGRALKKLRTSRKKYKYLAGHDPLTGIYNRRLFDEIVEKKLSEGILRNGIFCMLDIDNFKIFNDTHGHAEGDNVIKHIVEIAKGVLRKTDVIGRYGGEEFIFFFENTERIHVMNIVERIRESIEKTPVVLDNKSSVQVTASIGIAEAIVYDKNENVRMVKNQAIKRADEALYMAKRQGRNRICVAPPADESIVIQIE